MKRLLTTNNAKTIKGEPLGVLTGILYLAPANESGVLNVCTSATKECKQACLFTAGRAAIFPAIRRARIERTRWLARDRAGFIAQLKLEIAQHIKRANKLGLKPAIRVNGTSDLPWLAHEMAREFPNIQFYDYTKHVRPWQRTLPNYDLTFSYSGHNLRDALDALKHGINVAVVFSTRKGQPLPVDWNGYEVIDGDQHDCRFLDKRGVVVGLRAKGQAIGANSPFVVLAA